MVSRQCYDKQAPPASNVSGSAPSLVWLDPAVIGFPDPHHALDEPDGLLAAGGALSVDWLLAAYSRGIFPWFNDDREPILWWSPNPRGVLQPGHLHLSRSLRKFMAKQVLDITFDQAFAAVIQQCATRRAKTGTWITPAMQQAYINLHLAGYAHSVEIWQDQQLVGGIYGVSLGRMYFGESMFSAITNASKIALVALAELCQQWDFSHIDCQMMTPHLQRMGAQIMPRHKFLQALASNQHYPHQHGSWRNAAQFSNSQALVAQVQQRPRL